MATVELLLTPLPAHVRTARRVGVAAARRAGLDDELVDELRLAIGEAVGRAVAVNAAHAPDTPVRIVVRDHPAGLSVEVTDAGADATLVDEDVEALLTEDSTDPRVALAVLAGLVDALEISSDGAGTTVRLTWPLPR